MPCLNLALVLALNQEAGLRAEGWRPFLTFFSSPRKQKGLHGKISGFYARPNGFIFLQCFLEPLAKQQKWDEAL